MKIQLVVIICLVIQQNTASGQTLQEMLKNAQSQTDQLHSTITSELDKIRMEMSDILIGIVNESLSHILKPLVPSPSPQLDDDLESASNELSSESEQIGKQISHCSAQADTDIQAAIKQFFFVFNPIHSESLTVLNTVVEQIIEWNNISDPTDIVARVHNILEAKKNEFAVNVLPSLKNELKKFKSVLFLIPASVSRCVSEALAN